MAMKFIAEKVFQKVGGGSNQGSNSQKKSGREKNVNLSDDGGGGYDAGMDLVQLGAYRSKNVLILMSDTGGGHPTSAEAIRDAFQVEFGDEYKHWGTCTPSTILPLLGALCPEYWDLYAIINCSFTFLGCSDDELCIFQIFVKDVWKEYTGWPLNDMESQYKFMVKHVQLWNVAFHITSPKWIHSVYLAAIAAFSAKEVEAGLMEYKPDIIISVHPLMQHIPLWVLKWQGLQNKVVFVTVITDLSSCHPTWFHPGVNRCYCPSQEVANRALQVGLEESQVRVYGFAHQALFRPCSSLQGI